MTPRLPVLLLVAAGCLGLAGLAAGLRSHEPGLPDFSQWQAGQERKSEFFGYLRPLLEAENRRILAQRQRLESIAADPDPGFFDGRWLERLAREYRLDPDAVAHQALIAELLLRVDHVPVSLGLAQAAKESGWGTSRFAAAGNALFGQRCFRAGCGIVPGARSAGARHEVRSFDSPRRAVASYLRNLNTHADYEALRGLRARLRERGQRITGFRLARELAGYSERGDDYIEEIRQMIRVNELGPIHGAP